MKTAVQQIIKRIDIMHGSDMNFSYEKISSILQDALIIEKTQIETALEEGIKYGNQPLQTFDYPAARYYSHTYIF